MSFENWHELHKIWPEHSKNLIFFLIGFLWPKYILFEVQKYRGVIFYDTEETFFIVMTHNSTVNLKLIHFLLWTKGSYQSSNFEKRHEKFGKFSPEHLKKCQNWWNPFVQSSKGMTLKFTEELCVMAMKNNANLKRNWLSISKLTWGI